MPESHEVKALENICCEWLKNLDNPVNDNQYLTMTIIPILFAGKLSLLYNQLLYFDTYQTPDGVKIVLAFDNTNTALFIDENMDMQSVELEVIAALEKEEQELVESIHEAENEMQKIKGENPYEQAVKKALNTYQYEVPESTQNPNIRFSTEEDNEK